MANLPTHATRKTILQLCKLCPGIKLIDLSTHLTLPPGVSGQDIVDAAKLLPSYKDGTLELHICNPHQRAISFRMRHAKGQQLPLKSFPEAQRDLVILLKEMPQFITCIYTYYANRSLATMTAFIAPEPYVADSLREWGRLTENAGGDEDEVEPYEEVEDEESQQYSQDSGVQTIDTKTGEGYLFPFFISQFENS